eukprot:853512_1
MTDLVVKQGYLYKESKHLKVFRKRYIVLKGYYLHSYKNKHLSKHTDQIDLTSYKHISINSQSLKFELISKHQSRQFIASSIQDLTEWIEAIKTIIDNIHTINNNITPTTTITQGEPSISDSETIYNTPNTKPKPTHKTSPKIVNNINISSDSNVHITAYWEGYTEQDCSFPLNEIPETVNIIPIAFIQPIKDPDSGSSLATTWDFDDQFVYKKEDIKQWINEINNRGTNQRVLLSILDTPTCHWYPDVDIDMFAKNIAKDCDEWGIGGIDVDAESGMSDPSQMYVKTFVTMIKALRKYLSKDKIITYTCYTQSQWDTDIISQCKNDIEYINTMAYWGNKDAQISLWQHYVNDIGDANKVGIGVKAGNGGDSTRLDTVKQCAQWVRDNNDIKEKRMMLWSLTRDVKDITSVEDGTFLETIYENIIPGNYNDKIMKDIMGYIDLNTLNDIEINSDGGKVNVIQNITVNNYNTTCLVM